MDRYRIALPLFATLVFAAGCTSTAATTTTPPASKLLTVTTATTAATTIDTPPPNAIFFNGQVVTMDPDLPQAQALALRGDTIVAVGSDQEITALSGSETVLIDLGGRTLLPGFVDPHTHPFGSFESVDSLETGQQHTLEGGTTTIGETFVSPDKLERIMLALEETRLRIRTNLYLAYNDKCNGILNDGVWILDHSPILDTAQMLRIPGVKIIADPAGPTNRCGWAAMSVPLPPEFVEARNAGPYGEDLFSEEELAELIAQHQALGYQVIVHSRGDVTVETVLNAMESALAGQPNTFRHRIEHNDFIRPDSLSRYGEIGAVPTVRGRPFACFINDNGDVHFFGEEVQPWFNRVRSLIDANPGLPVAWHSDVGSGGRRPIRDLYDLVTRKAIRDDGTVCEPPAWLAAEAVGVEEALRLMTINGAYALFMEDKVGSLTPGKFADLIILSQNPLAIDPDEIIDIEVLMTMVGGNVEHCLPGHEPLCADPGS